MIGHESTFHEPPSTLATLRVKRPWSLSLIGRCIVIQGLVARAGVLINATVNRFPLGNLMQVASLSSGIEVVAGGRRWTRTLYVIDIVSVRVLQFINFAFLKLGIVHGAFLLASIAALYLPSSKRFFMQQVGSHSS